MTELLLFTLTSFLIGLSGAVAPGPLLTVTVSDSVQRGFRAGSSLITGHIIGEVIIVALIFLGLEYILSSEAASSLTGLVGGSVLIWMGAMGLRRSDIKTEGSDEGGSFLKGLVISYSNPYFFIWWGAVGAALMYRGVEMAGFLGILGFLAGHWLADIGWYSTVSFLSSRKSFDTGSIAYRVLMVVCNGFIVIAGLYFALKGVLSIAA
ncbi:lysine transporter [Methanothermobacter wolfeii]|uniref:LysE family transporter n=1 Tax=Methanothermobacter wolfeii TaxID=145261 RepID=UPI00092DE2FF|nr:lysine transporter [Methanothermobacter wolfeii]